MTSLDFLWYCLAIKKPNLQRIVQSSHFCHLTAIILEKSILGVQIPVSIRVLVIVSCDEPWVSVYKVSSLKSRNYFLKYSNIRQYFYFLIQTLTKSMISCWLCVQHLANSVSQIFLPYLPFSILFLSISLPRHMLPVVEVLQLVHDLVHVPIIVMGGQVVNSATKGLARIKEGIKPIRVASSGGGTHQNLNKIRI